MGQSSSKRLRTVTSAFKALIEEFTCKKCTAVLFARPNHGEAEALRCACGDCNVDAGTRRDTLQAKVTNRGSIRRRFVPAARCPRACPKSRGCRHSLSRVGSP